MISAAIKPAGPAPTTTTLRPSPSYGALSGKNGECALNPAVGQERFFANMPKDGEGRRVVVVGAGPAGLMAAEIMARRGFAVTRCV